LVVVATGPLILAEANVNNKPLGYACLIAMAVALFMLVLISVRIAKGSDRQERLGLALSLAWILAVALHAAWLIATDHRPNHWENDHYFAVVLPLIFGWACLGLYRWGFKLPGLEKHTNG
jgi:hypothetical protein